MIRPGYRCMLAEETFLVYFYGTAKEILLYNSLTGEAAENLESIKLLLSRIRCRR